MIKKQINKEGKWTSKKNNKKFNKFKNILKKYTNY